LRKTVVILGCMDTKGEVGRDPDINHPAFATEAAERLIAMIRPGKT
jgi:hypothetical protein